MTRLTRNFAKEKNATSMCVSLRTGGRSCCTHLLKAKLHWPDVRSRRLHYREITKDSSARRTFNHLMREVGKIECAI